MSASKLEAGQLIIEAFKAALDTIDNFVGNDGPSYERAKRGLDVAEEFFRTEQPQPAEDLDEWVIQDKVPVRVGDRCYWVGSEPLPECWSKMWQAHPHALVVSRKNRHGDKTNDGKETLHVMCRRRDLPKVEQAEQWPKYYKPSQPRKTGYGKHVAYCKCSETEKGETVHTDGTSFGFTVRAPGLDWTEITETEAMWLLDKPTEPEPQPQPQKTRVRLWIRNDPRGSPSVFACDQERLAESNKYLEIHYDHETRQFYTEEQS